MSQVLPDILGTEVLTNGQKINQVCPKQASLSQRLDSLRRRRNERIWLARRLHLEAERGFQRQSTGHTIYCSQHFAYHWTWERNILLNMLGEILWCGDEILQEYLRPFQFLVFVALDCSGGEFLSEYFSV